MFKRLPHWVLLFCFFVMLSTADNPATAQTVPSQADPARQPSREAVREDKTGISPKGNTVSIEEAAPVFLQVPDNADTISFTLKQITLDGVTAYLDDDFRHLYQQYLGAEVSAATLYDIANKITQRYHADGYVLSRAIIPPQETVDGAFTIRVIEGYVAEIEVEGEADSNGIIEAMLDDIKQMRPLNVVELEQSILLLNDLPGLMMRVIMLPATTTDGGIKLAVVPTRAESQHSVSFDNLNSRFFDSLQLSYHGKWHNIVGNQYDELGVRFSTDPSTELLKSAQVEYKIPVSKSGLLAWFKAHYSQSQLDYTLANSDIEGDSLLLSFGADLPIIRSRNHSLFGGVQFDYQNTTTDALATSLFDDRIRSLRTSLRYEGIDRFYGATSAKLIASQGLDVLDATRENSLNKSRGNGRAVYTKLRADMSRYQHINGYFSLYTAMAGQYAWDPLLSAEEIGFGGSVFGRGYDASEFTGDHGLMGMAELRYRPIAFQEIMTIQPFIFGDIGKVWNVKQALSSINSAASAGLGSYFTIRDLVSGNVYLAKPLTAAAGASDRSDANDWRLFFALSYSF